MSEKNNKQYNESETIDTDLSSLDTEMQSKTLYDITQDVAKNILHIRKEDKHQTQKILVIGQAMISQQNVLASIAKAQENINSVISSDFKNVIQTQDNAVIKLDILSENLKPMQDAYNVQKEIVQSLQTLKTQHSQFTNDYDAIKLQQMQCIVELQTQVHTMYDIINNTNITESFISLDDMLKSVMNTFETYKNTRTQQQEILAQHITVTTTALNQFQTDIDIQSEAIQRIEEQANMSCNATIVIDDKLDQILAHCESKADEQLPTLEEAFAIKEPQEAVQEQHVAVERHVMSEPPVKKSMMKRLFGGK